MSLKIVTLKKWSGNDYFYFWRVSMGFGILEKELSRKVNVGEFRELQQKVKDLETVIEKLLNGESNQPPKEYYTVKDLSEVMKKEPSTIRKNYIKEGHIECFRPEGSNKLLISSTEYRRVCDLVNRYGPDFVRRVK